MLSERPVSVANSDLLQRIDKSWAPARAAGSIGKDSIETLRNHALGYILKEWQDAVPRQFVDCGTGAGVLGVLLALELPESSWCLVDSRSQRCDMARRTVLAADLTKRVSIKHELVEETARSARECFDAAVARSFGPPAELAECALPLVKVGGILVVSVSEVTLKNWLNMPLSLLGCETLRTWKTPHGRYLAVQRRESAPDKFPRRRPARLRSPLSCFT